MSANSLEEICRNLRKARNERLSRQQKESYLQMASRFNRMFQDMEEHQRMLKKMSQLAYDGQNPILAEQLKRASKTMEQDIELMQEICRLARTIANQ